MRFIPSILFIVLHFSILDGLACNLTPAPILLAKYNESVHITQDGDLTSLISIELQDSCTELRLPLLINDNISIIKSSEYLNTSIVDNIGNKYLLIKSIGESIIASNIYFEISYSDYFKKNRFLNKINKAYLLLDYSGVNKRPIEVVDYRASIIAPKSFKLLPEKIAAIDSDELKINKSINTNEINIAAADLMLSEIEIPFNIIIKHPISITPYIAVIVLLLAIYFIFLRHIFRVD
ncbi:MAG: hypothetical protein ABFS32_09625 [Bacteroidota bacterium]